MESPSILPASDMEIDQLLHALDSLAGPGDNHRASADIGRQLRQAIAQRKAAEEALRRREHEFEALVENAADVIARYDREFRHIYINQAVEQATGRPPEAFLGKTNRELGMPAELCDAWDSTLRQAFAGDREVTCSFAVAMPDGRRYYEARLVPELDADGSVRSVMSIARDVTEARRCEESLQRERLFIRQIIDASPNLVFAKDESGSFVLVNQAMADLYQMTPAELVNRFNGDVLARPEDLAEYHRVDEQVLRTMRPVTIEEMHHCADGRTLWFQTTKAPIQLPDGHLGVVGVAVDITEHKRAEHALRENDVLFRRLCSSSIIGIIQGGAERIDDANDVFLKMIGYSRDELGKGEIRWPDLTPPDYAETDRQAMRDLTGSGVCGPFEKEYIRKDGRRVAVMLGGATLSREPLRWIAFVMDLSDLKRAQAERMRLASLVEKSPDFIGLARFDGTPMFLNRGGRLLMGLEPDGPVPPVVEFLFPEDRAFYGRTVLPTLEREGRWAGEFNFRHFRTHEPIAMLWDVFRIDDPQTGEAMCVATVSRDIRQRKRAEAERERLLKEARDAREEAESANRMKDQFLAVLSHELRTPLAPVLALAQLMLRDSAVPMEQRAQVETIRRNVELEARLIDDLLDLTRLSRGKMELRLAVVDLHRKVRHVLEICDSDIRAKQLRVTTDLSAPNPLVKVDAARMQQVLWNLLKNAIKFTPAGGEITIRTENRENCIRISVRDTGIGIDPGVLPRLFNAFEQGGRDVTRQFGGLGLGLAISKQVAELHGGVLTAWSEGPGKGSTFTLELTTVSDAGEVAAADSPGAEAPATQGGRLLLVEDHPDTGRSMSLLLRSLGYQVTLVVSVAEALQTARAERFDLIVSDLGLPDGSGLDIMRQLRSEGPIKGIALSGYGSEEDIRRSRDAGFAAHLTKPINTNTLEQTIRMVLA